ncbi:Stk1 family PASTA domain-containing Ser/Thr kinase [Veillonella intestinalis]|uniref:Stk1 family PASTA domain-containing Ser/Thr kinase n=1 Tax=Veillonella intestinalis TaxID=2941341 RepID=UPI002040CB9D|nr:Stk1 family PASTA domain-containing Ser/Thr kinase [Veillonella intestinalis]
MKETATKLQDLVLDNRYKIISKIGVGGMADVFKGEDLLLGRPVAIKVLHQNFAGDDDFVARFKREAQAAGKLSHPNIVSMYDVGFDQGYHYIVMEYIEGETLKEYITRHERLPIDNAVKFTIAIAEGLEHAHAMGIVHCDIKPHNVLITKQGRIKVTDFGIARAMNAGTTMMYTNSIMGSAHYLSPEQASGKPVNGSTDIYSLGAVLYEMLTGRVPYEGETPISVALKHVREKLISPTRYNPSIPTLLESAVIKSLAKRPEDRFNNISEMISALRMSQGFVSSNSGRRVPHDFGTQVMVPVSESPYGELEEDDVYYGNEPVKESWLTKLSRLPQKYILLGAFFVFLLAFAWAFLSFGNFWSNATVDVPNVVGKQVSVAKHILEDNHLRVSTSEVSNPDVPAGQVISQSPEAGEQVKEQRTVHLVVSKGVGDITMPDITGMTLEQAKSRLKGLGLVVGKITTASEDGKEDGVILMQSPPSDSKVTKGTTVDVTVNRVKVQKIELPNLVGMTIKEAKEALTALGLTVGPISGSSEDTAVVTQQNPESGSSLDANTAVSLTGEVKKKADPKPSDSSVTKGTVDITVPSGKANQSVRIVVTDDAGSNTVFDGTAQPGERIVKDVSGTGKVQIQVYLNGALVQDQTL